MRRLPLRTRLALWHAAAVTLVLATTAALADRALSRWVEGQLDAALVALAETEAASALDGAAGEVHLHAGGAWDGSVGDGRLERLVQIVDAEGRVIDRTPSLGDARLPAPPALLARLRAGDVVIETAEDVGGEPVRLVSIPIEVRGRFAYAIQVGARLAPPRAFLRTARLLFLGAAGAVLAAVLGIGRVLAGAALRPVERLVDAARRIDDASLATRLPHPGTDDEIGRLASTLNDMLARIERGVEAQRRFTADASHELRAPLSRLRSELEIALRRPRSAAEYEAVLRSSLEEVERLAALTADLLTLARLDTGRRGPSPGPPARVAEVLGAVLERLRPEAERRGIAVTAEIDPRLAVSVPGPELALVAGNLLDNALKFTQAGGRVAVGAVAEGDDAVLTVADNGPGIAAEELPRVFERFFRSPARPVDAPGAGLGLAICRAVVEAAGGRVAVESPPSGGATFTVRLPRSS